MASYINSIDGSTSQAKIGAAAHKQSKAADEPAFGNELDKAVASSAPKKSNDESSQATPSTEAQNSTEAKPVATDACSSNSSAAQTANGILQAIETNFNHVQGLEHKLRVKGPSSQAEKSAVDLAAEALKLKSQDETDTASAEPLDASVALAAPALAADGASSKTASKTDLKEEATDADRDRSGAMPSEMQAPVTLQYQPPIQFQAQNAIQGGRQASTENSQTSGLAALKMAAQAGIAETDAPRTAAEGAQASQATSGVSFDAQIGASSSRNPRDVRTEGLSAVDGTQSQLQSAATIPQAATLDLTASATQYLEKNIASKSPERSAIDLGTPFAFSSSTLKMATEALSNGGSRALLSVNPQGLGQVEAIVNTEKNVDGGFSISMSMAFSSNEALQAAKANMGALISSLSMAGFANPDIKMEIAPQRNADNNGSPFGAGAEHQRQGHNNADSRSSDGVFFGRRSDGSGSESSSPSTQMSANLFDKTA